MLKALLGYFVIAAAAGVVASAFVGFVLANLRIAQRASLDNWLGCRGFCVSPTIDFQQGLRRFMRVSCLAISFFAERSSDTTATNPPHPFRLRSLARSARLDCSNTRSISACSTRLRSIVLQRNEQNFSHVSCRASPWPLAYSLARTPGFSFDIQRPFT